MITAMDRRTAGFATLVLTACGAVVTPADDADSSSTSGTTTSSTSGPGDPTSVGSQVDGDPPPPTGDDSLDDGPLDESSSTDPPPSCDETPAPELTTHAVGDLGSRASDVLVIDVTNDGHAEILLANPSLGAVHMLDGTAPLDVAMATVIIAYGPAFAIAATDLDQTSTIDLVLAHSDGRIEIQLGDGTGAFVSTAMLDAADELYDVEVGDLDGDGSIDAFALGHTYTEGSVWWLRGGGDGTFATAENLLTDDWPHAYSVGLAVIPDARRPGADAAVAQIYDNDQQWIALLRPNEAPEIVEELPHSVTGLVVGDLDDDGIHDIAALGTETAELFRWTGNDGGGFTTLPTDGAYRGIGVRLAVGELDGSGAMDMIAGYGLDPLLERVRSSCDGGLNREWLDVTLGSDLLHVIATGDLDDDEIDDIVVVDGSFGGQDITALLTSGR
jgi:hypothetical protein